MHSYILKMTNNRMVCSREMSINLKKLSVWLVFLFLAASVIAVDSVKSAREDEATLAITAAEKNLGLAYQATRDAEVAGANLSGLLFQLNEAAELLVQANVSYRIGDFNNATIFANASTEIANKVRIEAYKARDIALYERVERFQFALTESILGIGIVICGSFLGWRLFKRRYYQWVLKLKPEMGSDES